MSTARTWRMLDVARNPVDARLAHEAARFNAFRVATSRQTLTNGQFMRADVDMNKSSCPGTGAVRQVAPVSSSVSPRRNFLARPARGNILQIPSHLNGFQPSTAPILPLKRSPCGYSDRPNPLASVLILLHALSISSRPPALNVAQLSCVDNRLSNRPLITATFIRQSSIASLSSSIPRRPLDAAKLEMCHVHSSARD